MSSRSYKASRCRGRLPRPNLDRGYITKPDRDKIKETAEEENRNPDEMAVNAEALSRDQAAARSSRDTYPTNEPNPSRRNQEE